MAKAAATCATCPHWDAPKPANPAASLAHDTAGVYSMGTCRRYPQIARKQATDVCGEHPELLAERQLDIETWLAAQRSKSKKR